jgi:hypothetical protein
LGLQLFLGLLGSLGLAPPFRTARPLFEKTLFKTFWTPWTDVTVEKWPSPKKITKALDRKLADGRE